MVAVSSHNAGIAPQEKSIYGHYVVQRAVSWVSNNVLRNKFCFELYIQDIFKRHGAKNMLCAKQIFI